MVPHFESFSPAGRWSSAYQHSRARPGRTGPERPARRAGRPCPAREHGPSVGVGRRERRPEPGGRGCDETVAGAGRDDHRRRHRRGYRIRKYVGAYQAVLGRLDAVVFTAGVGENSAVVRERALTGLEPLGIVVDPARNASGAPARTISADAGRVAVCVVPTDEERGIAEETAAVLRAP
ncbi:hypothetical protein C6W10_18780 [Plantactinospora sp. BB1]|nr:hypothetical protein C6W10_18780 [Plantactinospora sp. BB1]